MIICKSCGSPDFKIIESDTFGDNIVAQCANCQNVFELERDELEQNEYHED